MINPKISVALIGNMNNNFFTLSRYLRDLGFDSFLYILPFDPEHFLPQSDTFNSDFDRYVKRINWGNPYELGAVTKDEIRQEFGSFDFIIGCGTAPAYLSKGGLKLDLFIPYGSDLYHYPFFNLLQPKNLISYMLSVFNKPKELNQLPSKPANIKGYVPFVIRQRWGIKDSKTIAFPTSGSDIYAEALKSLRYKNTHLNMGIPLIYINEFGVDTVSRQYSHSISYLNFRKIRESHDFVIFHNCRHNWKYEKDINSFKGNDRLLRGFAEFIKTFTGKAAIVTFEYGTDVAESKLLASELGIEDNIFWFPTMPRKELMIGMSLSDLVVGNLSDFSWLTYGVVYEAMALAKPIMHHRNDKLYSSAVLYPMINAFDDETVQKALTYYSKNRNDLAEIGLKANQFFNENNVNVPLHKIVELINIKVK